MTSLAAFVRFLFTCLCSWARIARKWILFFVPSLERTSPLQRVVFAALGLIAISLLWSWTIRPPAYVPREDVWRYVERHAPDYNLDPYFVLAIAKAESTFDANARNRRARGIMQLTPPAWETVTDRPFRHAYRWKVGLDSGMAYLAHLREDLERQGAFSYPRLAAAYRYGPNALREADFDLENLPETRNRVYRELFSGNRRPVETGV